MNFSISSTGTSDVLRHSSMGYAHLIIVSKYVYMSVRYTFLVDSYSAVSDSRVPNRFHIRVCRVIQ